MLAWRIAKQIHALDRLGTGARLFGGRWNSVGVPAIYAGLTPEIAALEKLVHTGNILPDDLVLVEITLPDSRKLYQELTVDTLPTDWNDMPSSTTACKIGDKFLVAGTHLGLIVPSAVMQEANNILINPNHPSFSLAAFTIVRPFEFDSRLR